jgi:hypothetical protein
MIANLKFPELLDSMPVIGLAVWAVILATAPLRRPDWQIMPHTFQGTIFLLALVTCAWMMPVEELPSASWQTALGLGFVSAVFDNIPLTALALRQGGYDWGFLAYAVGFGGSMIWFGSSAGVALSNMYPEARSVGLWLTHGWHIAIAYVIGFLVMLAVLGWHPDTDHRERVRDLGAPTSIVTASAHGAEGAPPLDECARGLISRALTTCCDRAEIKLQFEGRPGPARAAQRCTYTVTERSSFGVRARAPTGSGSRGRGNVLGRPRRPVPRGVASARRLLLARPWRGWTGTPYC